MVNLCRPSALFNHRWHSNCQASRRDRRAHHGVGANMAIIADLNVAQQLRSCPNDHVVTNARCAAAPSEVTQGDAMIDGAILPNMRLRMHDNATEVMQAQALADPSLRWKRDTRGDLSETLNHESQRLGWNAVLVTPAKDAIDE